MAKIVFNTMSEAKDYLDSDFNEFLNSPYCITEEGIRDELEAFYPTRNGDDEMNETAYEGLSNLDVDDYIDCITNNDLLLDEYENWLSDYNTEDELDVSSDCVSEMAGELTNKTDIEENFDNALNSYMSYCERHCSGFGEENDDINIDLEYNEEDNSVDDWSDLAEVDDKIGEQTNVEYGRTLDYDTRDGAFVYIDGDVAYGEEGKTHGQILADYMEELGNEDMIPEDLKGDDIARSRPTQSRMRRLVDTDNVAFGHIVDNMAFVEVLETGANENDVAKACKKQLKVDKVYFLDNDNHIVKRLAKWKVYTK